MRDDVVVRHVKAARVADANALDRGLALGLERDNAEPAGMPALSDDPPALPPQAKQAHRVLVADTRSPSAAAELDLAASA